MLAPKQKLRLSHGGTYRLASFLLKRYVDRARMHDFPQTEPLQKLLHNLLHTVGPHLITLSWNSYYDISFGTAWIVSPHETFCTINLGVRGLSKQYFTKYVKRLSKSTESKVEEV